MNMEEWISENLKKIKQEDIDSRKVFTVKLEVTNDLEVIRGSIT